MTESLLAVLGCRSAACAKQCTPSAVGSIQGQNARHEVPIAGD